MSFEIIHTSEEQFASPVAHSSEDIDAIDPIEEVEIQQNGQLAMGLKVPTSVEVPTSYLDNLRKYKDIYNDIYQQMEVATKLYRYNGIIGNAVDVLIDFAVTKVYPEPTGDKQLDTILRHWFETVNYSNTNSLPGIYPLAQELALEWFTSGNAFPYTKWTNEEIEDLSGTWKLPSSINLINPQSIKIPDGPIAFGQEVIYLKYDADILDKIGRDGRSDPEAALIKSAIPKTVLRAFRNKSINDFDGVRLNPKYIKHLKRRAKGYQAWGVPYLTRCFASSSLLERLRELDESITAGLINLITIFKIGTEEHPASPARLRKFAGLLRNPKATHTLVWAHDVEILQVGPDGKVLAFKEKYKDAKEDILISLGIPPVLMSLKGDSDAWVSILSLVERLSHWRKTISLWLEGVCNDIAKYNGYNNKVKVKWDRMNLTDEQAIKNLVLSFYDRGLISIKTALKESNYDYKTELDNKTAEKPQIDLFLPPNLPFSGKGQETDKGNPGKNDPKQTTKENKKQNTKTENTVNLKPQIKKAKPKAR